MKKLLGALLLGGALAACSGGSSNNGNGNGGNGGNTTDGGTHCTDTCDAEGGTECRQPGVRTCQRNAQGCLEWSAVQACDQGSSCVEGRCLNCVSACQEGSVRCGPNGGLQQCAIGQSGCYDWADEQPCGQGESCSAGECRPGGQCVNECATAGAHQCAADGLQTCAQGNDGCLHWGPAAACPQGQTCSIDSCRPAEQCVDECQAGSQQCRNDGYVTCGNFDDDACSEWSAVVPCPQGQVCSNGQCAASCANECGPMGARQCSANGVQTCGNFDSDDCLEWGGDAPCAEGQNCSNGQCRAACVDECAMGSMQCSGNGVQTCGNFDDDACLEWGAPVPCDQGQSCSNGRCAVACQNECDVANTRRCGAGGVQNCGNFDDDPCLEWSVAMACAGGQVCANGQCADRCTDECAPGSQQCSGNGVQRCGNFDDDECLEWSAPVGCAAGESCSNGRCTAQCQDECRPGQTQCSPGGLQRCGNFDDDACNEWGAAQPCPAGQSCSNSVCADACVNECSDGARRCTANGVQTCGNFDGDPCTEWSADAPCPMGQVCSNGQCAQNCSDECAQGTVQCAGNGFESCGNFDGDACLEWSAITPCQDGTSCSGGVCSQFCRDECVNGATRCGNSGVETCGNFDGDPCSEWGAGVACPMGQVCANGACAAQCADECAAGQMVCDGAGVKTCGNFDGDPCREWSAVSPCANGQVCANGQCQAPHMGCQNDAGCLGGQICAFDHCVAPKACMADGDCFAGERCQNQICRPQAASVLGQACQQDADCGAGFICNNPAGGGFCIQLCDVTNNCPTGATCYNVGTADMPTNVCLPDCAAAPDCRPGQVCYPSAVGGFCYLPQCQQDVDCQSDPSIIAHCDAGQCVQDNACDLQTGMGCPMGQQCYQVNGVGACIALCTAFGANQCPAGEACVPTGNDTEGNCIRAGMGGPNAACASQYDCGAGLRCVDDGAGNARCLPICDTQAASPCANGQVCTPTDGRAGVCIDPCQSECNADTTRCTAQGQQTCGQADADLCLEWLPAAACGAGQTCQDLYGDSCQAACHADADCANVLVPARCVQGACTIQSQCQPGGAQGCAAPAQCFAASNDGTKGVCLETCDPLHDACSQQNQSCSVFGSGSYCTVRGGGQPGDPCATSVDCGSGELCLTVADNTNECLQICDSAGGAPGCSAGEACYDLGVDGHLGVCAAAQ